MSNARNAPVPRREDGDPRPQSQCHDFGPVHPGRGHRRGRRHRDRRVRPGRPRVDEADHQSDGADNLLVQPGTAVFGGVSFVQRQRHYPDARRTPRPSTTRFAAPPSPPWPRSCGSDPGRATTTRTGAHVPRRHHAAFLDVRDWHDLDDGDMFTDKEVARQRPSASSAPPSSKRSCSASRVAVNKEIRIQQPCPSRSSASLSRRGRHDGASTRTTSSWSLEDHQVHASAARVHSERQPERRGGHGGLDEHDAGRSTP